MLWMGIWVHPYTVTPVRVGVDFRKIGVWRSLSDAVVSWLRLCSVPAVTVVGIIITMTAKVTNGVGVRQQ
jgi:hypothetical protein